MMWKMMASIALAGAVLTMAAPGPAAAQGASATASVTAAEVTAALQNMVGTKDEAGFMVESVTSEGNMIIFVFVGPDGWREGLDAQQVSDALVQGFCEEGSSYFDLGLTMRVDSIDRTARLKGPVVSACPK